MKNNSLLVWLAVIVGVAFIILGIYYFRTEAGNLPSYIPGHIAGSTIHHTKHGIASILLGVASFVFAWFKSGTKSK